MVVNVLKARFGPPLALGQGQPQLQQPDLSPGGHVLAVNDPAPGGHPLHFARVQFAAFVWIEDRSVEQQRHRLEPGMRVRTADRPIADIEVIVHQKDERIGCREIILRQQRRSEVAGADEARSERRRRDDAGDATLKSGHVSSTPRTAAEVHHARRDLSASILTTWTYNWQCAPTHGRGKADAA